MTATMRFIVRDELSAATVSPARKRSARMRPAATLTAMRSDAATAPSPSCTTTDPKVSGGEIANASHCACSS